MDNHPHPVRNRILMLVPHDPDIDPRIRWVIDLCQQFGPTEVIGAVMRAERPARQYAGRIYTERVNVAEYMPMPRLSMAARLLARFLRNPHKIYRPALRGLLKINAVRRLVFALVKDGENNAFIRGLYVAPLPPVAASSTAQAAPRPGLRKRLSRRLPRLGLSHFAHMMLTFWLLANTLARRGRAVSIPPALIICHDIYALQAAVHIKKHFGCPVIYDSHELWPEADLQAQRWEKWYITVLERRLIRHADAVITVSPQIARYLERLYGLNGVISVPNAEPIQPDTIPSCERPLNSPVKFLLQGRAAPGRGIDTLLALWRQVKDERAVLVLRIPVNAYLLALQAQFDDLIAQGRLLIAEAVGETELVSAASEADIGIIPYGGPNLNHVYACPNKLSQYMQAGLAILSNADTLFVQETTHRYACGQTYDTQQPESFVRAVQFWLDNPDELQTAKENAYQAAQSEFHWQTQAVPYKQAIQRFLDNDRESGH